MSLSLRFSNKIEPEDMLCGRAEVQFKGTLSSVDGVDLFFPTGAKRAEITNKVGTTVAVDFTLSLARVRYQDTRVVPDPKLPQDHTFQASSIYEGVVPDYATVIALTKALSAGDIYIKRLVENPPRIGERVSQRNRYWDITGRFYTVVYPIDIHIVLSGEEVHNGEIRAQGGTSYIDLTVQGTYVNSAMEAQIVQLWENLRALIDDTMRMLPRTRSAIQASLEDEAAPPLGVSAWPAPDESLFHPALVGTEGWATSGVSGVERARERLDKLIQSINTAALPPAQISEELMLIAHDLDRDSGAPRGLRQAEVGGLQ